MHITPERLLGGTESRGLIAPFFKLYWTLGKMMRLSVQGPAAVVTFIAVLQVAVFVLSLWAIFKLWMTVIEFVTQKPTINARALAQILGRSEAGGAGTA